MRDIKNIGIVGCANIVPRAIINPTKEIEHLRVYGVASRSTQKAKEYADKYDIPHVYSDYEELIHSEDIDIVYIALPNHVHCEWLVKALNAGKNTIIEKPICLSSNEFDIVLDAYYKNKAHLLEGVMIQHHPWQKWVKEFILNKSLGDLVKIDTKICINKSQEIENGYNKTPSEGGGCFIDLNCYWLQFLQHIIGLNVKDIDANSEFRSPNGCDLTFTASINIDNIKSNVICSYELPYKVEHILDFENGSIRVADFFRSNLGNYKLKIYITDYRTDKKTKRIFDPQWYYKNQLRYFYNVITGVENECDIQLSGERIALMEQIYNVAKDNHRLRGKDEKNTVNYG